jgi:hypothetical protein
MGQAAGPHLGVVHAAVAHQIADGLAKPAKVDSVKDIARRAA